MQYSDASKIIDLSEQILRLYIKGLPIPATDCQLFALACLSMLVDL